MKKTPKAFAAAVRAAVRTRKPARISMVTAYDAPTARLAEAAGIDWLLVGDSVATVLLGFDSTRGADIETMRHHTQAVRRGSLRLPVVSDLPYPSVRQGHAALVRDARSLIRSGADAVKIEWTPRAEAQTAALVRAGVPVMGHVGLTPQDLKPGAVFKVRGGDPRAARRILDAALAFERLGAFAVVVECVPQSVAREVTDRLRIPVIGIGAGPQCDGQVLVFHDLMGLTPDFSARFVKRYADLWPAELDALRRYAREVRSGAFPDSKHSYGAPE